MMVVLADLKLGGGGWSYRRRTGDRGLKKKSRNAVGNGTSHLLPLRRLSCQTASVFLPEIVAAVKGSAAWCL